LTPDKIGKAGGAAGRGTMHLFDVLFKHALKESSPQAIAHFINGLFGKSRPPGSAVTFLSAKAWLSETANWKRSSPIILAVETEIYLMEAQIDEDKP
jgi:hypothetical protein